MKYCFVAPKNRIPNGNVLMRLLFRFVLIKDTCFLLMFPFGHRMMVVPRFQIKQAIYHPFTTLSHNLMVQAGMMSSDWPPNIGEVLWIGHEASFVTV
jgi:hypothetical protein